MLVKGAFKEMWVLWDRMERLGALVQDVRWEAVDRPDLWVKSVILEFKD
jgi:hypothetical protein